MEPISQDIALRTSMQTEMQIAGLTASGQANMPQTDMPMAGKSASQMQHLMGKSLVNKLTKI